MPSQFTLQLDTLGPGGVAVSIDGGATHTPDTEVAVTVTTTDATTTGYQVKLWGDIQGVPNEATAAWQTLAPGLPVTLTTGDGVKTVNARLRDDVWNESGTASDTITLDTTSPVVTLTAGPDPAGSAAPPFAVRVSRVAGKRLVTWSWQSSENFDHYEVRAVTNTNAAHTEGTLLVNNSGGGSNLSGDGAFAANTPITTVLDARDIPDPDGIYFIKVFVRDLAGNWSIIQ